ncbi:uncharacterized protein BYT42DRAFT_558074 [Radiomyces spectabilis]|uniref:uncharacterized protein n=1 Tax=Radiomyces spectabilis TaxID=64574 RepID=UPI00221FEA0B|nr:uncharacterized protein BYT42DRAFT_558074 [Radiomyces spectabilis]KAI8391786.1 hypothetical protein BYT42DRAFT_558074 [Radiomyces spectabilis]
MQIVSRLFLSAFLATVFAPSVFCLSSSEKSDRHGAREFKPSSSSISSSTSHAAATHSLSGQNVTQVWCYTSTFTYPSRSHHHRPTTTPTATISTSVSCKQTVVFIYRKEQHTGPLRHSKKKSSPHYAHATTHSPYVTKKHHHTTITTTASAPLLKALDSITSSTPSLTRTSTSYTTSSMFSTPAATLSADKDATVLIMAPTPTPTSLKLKAIKEPQLKATSIWLQDSNDPLNYDQEKNAPTSETKSKSGDTGSHADPLSPLSESWTGSNMEESENPTDIYGIMPDTDYSDAEDDADDNYSQNDDVYNTEHTENADEEEDEGEVHDDENDVPVPSFSVVPFPINGAAGHVDSGMTDLADTQAVSGSMSNKALGIGLGLGIGCVAALGLAGLLVHSRRKRKEQLLFNGNQNILDETDVNTRWRPQSFMGVVASVVAKLPRSPSQRSNASEAAASTKTTSTGIAIGTGEGATEYPRASSTSIQPPSLTRVITDMQDIKL